MSRSLSAALNSAILSQSSDKVLLTLLEISHEDLDDSIRLVNNTEKVIHDGKEYLPYWFTLALPREDNGKIESVKLVLDNTDRTMVYAARSISSPAKVTIKVVLASSPDTVELELADMILRNVSYDVNLVSGELIFEERLSYQVPALSFTPNDFPGIF